MFCLIESIDPFTYVVALVQVKRCFWNNEDIQKSKEQCHLGIIISWYTTAEAISRLSVNKLEPTLLVKVSQEVQVHHHTLPSTPFNHYSMYKLCDISYHSLFYDKWSQPIQAIVNCTHETTFWRASKIFTSCRRYMDRWFRIFTNSPVR